MSATLPTAPGSTIRASVARWPEARSWVAEDPYVGEFKLDGQVWAATGNELFIGPSVHKHIEVLEVLHVASRYGFTLAHSSEDTGGIVSQEFPTRKEAEEHLSKVLSAQRGAQGFAVKWEEGHTEWMVLYGKRTMAEERKRRWGLGWTG